MHSNERLLVINLLSSRIHTCELWQPTVAKIERWKPRGCLRLPG